MQVKHIEKILWESLELTPSFLPYLWILKQEFIKKILRVSFYWLSSNLWGCDGYCCMSIWLNSKIFPADKEIFYGTSPRCCSYNDVNCLKECIVSLFSDPTTLTNRLACVTALLGLEGILLQIFCETFFFVIRRKRAFSNCLPRATPS